MRKKTGIAFMSFGVICIVFAFAILLYNIIENKRAYEASLAMIDSLRTLIAEDENADPFDTEMKVVEIDGYGYVGYVTVPALDIDLPVMSECDLERLKIAPCRYYGSTKTDNLVIAAHNYKKQFGYLYNLKKDDIVIFTDMEANVYNYKVTSIDYLYATESDKVKDTGDDLILYTCNYSGSKRITVRCSYIQSY